MSEKVEGTLILDGLVEGELPDNPDAESWLRDWIRTTATIDLHFSLEMEGGHFSLLAHDRPVAAAKLRPVPATAIADLLNQFLQLFPETDRPRVFSTLRSIEYSKGTEIQTVYAVTQAGVIETQERILDADTITPEPPLSGKQRLQLALIGLVIALLLFAFSALFINYRAMFGNLWAQITPLDVEEIAVEADAFRAYFTVAEMAAGRGSRFIALTLARLDGFPSTDSELAAAYQALDGGAPRARLALDAIARGYIRCERFDKDGQIIGYTQERIKALRQANTVTIHLPVSSKRRPTRIVLTY